MQEELKNQQPQDDRPKYEPPQAMRLTTVRAGAGHCFTPGSGDNDTCYSAGNSAGYWCTGPGNTAITNCSGPGSSYS